MSRTTCRLVFDAHLHLYPSDSTTLSINQLIHNLSTLSARCSQEITSPLPTHLLGLLAETPQTHFFDDAIAGRIPLGDDLHIQPESSPGCLCIAKNQNVLLRLIAGHQIITHERLEVLALASSHPPPSGKPLSETLDHIQSSGAIPVISWAPGKWCGTRGKAVEHIIDTWPQQTFCLGDSSIRPALFPQPPLMRQGLRKGLTVLAGTDPLPIPGDQALIGTYGCLYEGLFDIGNPLDELRRLLLSPEAQRIQRIGKRNSLARAVHRWISFFLFKRKIVSG